MQTELKKAHASGDMPNVVNGSNDGEALHLLLNTMQGDGNTNNYDHDNDGHAHAEENSHDSSHNTEDTSVYRPRENHALSAHASPNANGVELPVTEQNQHESRDPVSNPLALLADASDAAQTIPNTQVGSGHERFWPGAGAHRPQYVDSAQGLSYGPSMHQPSYSDLGHEVTPESQPGTSVGRHLLHRPGYISLGLQLNRGSLENALDALFSPSPTHSLEYFRRPDANPPRDVGPDLDPVELGLVSIEEAYSLFPMYALHNFH